VPAIADIDLDGRTEIVVAGDYWDGIPGYYEKVWVYDLHGADYGPTEWGQFGGGPRHQSLYPTPTLLASGVDLVLEAPTMVGVLPGGVAAVAVHYANRGTARATAVTLTATLDGDLTYVSDTSGIPPTFDGDAVIWNLLPVASPCLKGFVLHVQVPAGAAYGTSYATRWDLASSGPEANPADNAADTEVVVARPVFLPLISRLGW
jgi:uncharacterized repeat protein (TIGR01451 family)